MGDLYEQWQDLFDADETALNWEDWLADQYGAAYDRAKGARDDD